ncbi:MAG: thioredoxin-like domain-containing protein [Xanthomonadales bacterium]|nr:thioredoxin-like domain-containing protein [Xanthomonadales bacterium]
MSDRTRIPEFSDSLNWVNTTAPPSVEECRGKVMLIYFWTPSNVNSLNFLPEIRALENKHENGLVVVGIVCPKFPREGSTASILKAVNRLFLRHAVAMDADFNMWQQYGVKAWPTAAVVDAEGCLRKMVSGDEVEKKLDAMVSTLLDEAASREIRNYGSLRMSRKPEKSAILQFPTCIHHDREHVYISDTGNNRILELTENGRILRVFGSGNPGFWDGMLENSGFNAPRGLAVAENYLYVADSGNHAIRRVNLFSGEIETVMGTGKPGRQVVSGQTALREIEMMMPMGLVAHGPNLYITMAGMNQIWRLDLKNNHVSWLSGSGQHGLVNGKASRAAFATPMGIALHNKTAFVIDADSSAVREISLGSGGVRTKAGRGTFTFGREDGGRTKALMQFPTDACLSANREQLWIADTFNNCLRLMDISSGQITTPAIEHEFHEPTCVRCHDRKLWVADTNAHSIICVHLADRACEPFDIIETGI